MRNKRCFWIVLSALGLTGCASTMATSYELGSDMTGYPTLGRSYARYSLQRTVLTVAIDDANSGAGAGPSAPGAATASITNTVTVSSGAAAAPATPAGQTAKPVPTPTLSATCADLRKSYDQNRILYISYISGRGQLEGRLSGWAKDMTTFDRSALNDALASYIVARKSGTSALIAATKYLITIQEYCPPTFKITITLKDEADPDSKSYLLTVHPNDLYDDQLSVQTGGDGTLVSVGYTSTDRTADIAANLAKTIATLTVSGLGIPPRGVAVAGQVRQPCNPTIGTAPGDWPAHMPPSPTVNDIKGLLVCVLQDPEDELDDIDVAHYEHSFVASGDIPVKLPHKLDAHLRCADDVAIRGPSGPQPGVLVSTPQPCIFAIGLKSGDADAPTDLMSLGLGSGEHVLSRTSFAAMNSHAPLVLPLERTSFVARTATYTFAGGRLTTATYNRPSPLVNAALLPSTVVGAFVGAVTGQITSRTSNLNAKTQYENAQTDYVNAKLKLQQAQAAAAKSAPTPAN